MLTSARGKSYPATKSASQSPGKVRPGILMVQLCSKSMELSKFRTSQTRTPTRTPILGSLSRMKAQLEGD